MATKLTSIEEPLNVLYYGDGGTGKTTHIAHMADLGKVLLINAESGVKARALQRCGVDVSNIEIFPEPGERLTYKTLEAEWLRLREELHKDPGAYVGTGWDSLTEIYKILLDDAVKAGAAADERRGKPREEGFIDRSDYGVMSEQVRGLVRKFRDLPCHFCASALERRDIDDDGTVVYRPAVTPGLQTDMYGWFDLVCHTQVVNVGPHEQYRGLFRPAGKFRGKDRYKVMPRELVNPTFDRVLDYVEESLSLEKDPVMKAAQQQVNEQKKETKTDAEAE